MQQQPVIGFVCLQIVGVTVFFRCAESAEKLSSAHLQSNDTERSSKPVSNKLYAPADLGKALKPPVSGNI